MEKDVLLLLREPHNTLDLDRQENPGLQGIEFKLSPGKVLALVDGFGWGKSLTSQALLRLLPRELRISSGQINFRDPDTQSTVDLASMPAECKAIRNIRGNHIAMIFQEPMSSFSLLHTIGNQIGEVIRLHLKATKAEARALSIDLLDKVGIPDPARAVDQFPYEFSGGMRQRAAIVRTLMEDRPVVLMDEPFSALDAITRLRLQELAAELLVGRTGLLVTHDPLEALSLIPL